MDRAIVYDGQTPQTTDILQTGKTNVVGLGFFLQGLLGTGVCVNGLACTQTSPLASMSVTVAAGSIYQQDAVDATVYGDLSTDANTIVKEGILYNALNLTPAFTGIAGQSQNFLVEVKFTDADGGSAVIPYYNASNPPSPLWGANFAATQALGTAQNTIRTSIVTVQLKAGTPATTGSQTTPTVDAGFTALYVITLPFGYTSITNANIAQLATAPFFPNLPAIPVALQNNAWTYAVDTGAVNAYVASIVPAPSALVTGMIVQIKIGITNTGTSSLNLNGLGVKTIHRGTTGAVLSAGDLTAGEIACFAYDGTFWQLVNFPNTFSTLQTNTFNSLPVAYAVDTGTTNNIVISANCNTPAGLGVNVPPGPIVSLFAGLTIMVKVANSNSGPTVITINNLPPVPVVGESTGDSLAWFAINAGELVLLSYDGSAFRKLPKKNKYFSWDESRPPRFPPWPQWPQWPLFGDWPRYWPPWPQWLPTPVISGQTPPAIGLLPLSIGDQVNITFSNVPSVPFNVATVPGIYEVEVNITSSNTECGDHWHMPNDVLFVPGTSVTPPFQCWPHRCHDDDNRNFQSDVFGAIAEPDVAFGRFPCFEQHRDGSPFGRAPFFLKFVCVTHTIMKHIRVHGGCYGGPFHHHARWVDVAIPWTSLGTLVVAQKRGHRRCVEGIDRASVSGLAYVRRIA